MGEMSGELEHEETQQALGWRLGGGEGCEPPGTFDNPRAVAVPAVSSPVAANNPMDLEPAAFRQVLARRGENRRTLMEWVASSLKVGHDFGQIHTTKKLDCHRKGPAPGGTCTPQLEPWHWSKPSLWKPGAEKICGMLGVRPVFDALTADERQQLAPGMPGDSIVLRCRLVSATTGLELAQGLGARSITKDYGDVNKALKMAEKSAHIDACLRMAGLSEVFTQDLEDMFPVETPEKPAEKSEPSPAQPEEPEAPRGLDPVEWTPEMRERQIKDKRYSGEDDGVCAVCGNPVGKYESEKGNWTECKWSRAFFLANKRPPVVPEPHHREWERRQKAVSE